MSNFDKAVEDGFKGAAVGGAIVASGVAIGAAVGASFGPFAAVAAPVGAALGALIGFFVSLGKHTPSPEEVAKAKAAQAEVARQSSNLKGMMNDPAYASLFANVRAAIVNMANQPGANMYISALKTAPIEEVVQLMEGFAPKSGGTPAQIAGTQALTLLKTISALSNQATDPMAYFTDPTLKALVGPGLAKAGIDVNNPNALKLMRANYANPPVNTGAIPIVRKSQTNAWNDASAAKGEGRPFIVDSRAFNPKIAPYGLSSLPPVGVPLRAPWPWGLDKDNFANPPPSDIESLASESLASGGWSTQKKVAAAAGLAGLGYLAYAFFL